MPSKFHPIVVKLTSFKTKEKLLSLCSQFKHKCISIGEDFSVATRTVRRKLIAFGKSEASSEPFKLHYDQLNLNGNLYVYNSDQIQELKQRSDNVERACPVLPDPSIQESARGSGSLSSFPRVYSNVRSASNKYGPLPSVIDTCSAKINALTETWLPAHVTNTEVFPWCCAIYCLSLRPYCTQRRWHPFGNFKQHSVFYCLYEWRSRGCLGYCRPWS